MQPLVSIVVPNWNGAAFLPGCLASLDAQSYPRREVILVDDASTDDSVAVVRLRFPHVHVVALERNRGFARAVNEGIRRARGEIVALLNNDAEAEPTWIERLVDALSRYPEAGFAASKILLYERRDVLHAAGDLYRCDGVPGNRGVWEKDRGQYDREEYVFGACAAAAAYRRSMLDDVGLFDERFGMYCEDVDLSFRAQLQGYRCIYVPTARVYHRLSATGGGPLASYFCGRNFVGLVVKNVPSSVLRRCWHRMLVAQLRIAIEALRHAREPAARARLRGQLAGLRWLPELLRARRDVQRRRTVHDDYVWSILS